MRTHDGVSTVGDEGRTAAEEDSGGSASSAETSDTDWDLSTNELVGEVTAR